MLAAERKSLILEKLQEEKKVIVSELSGQFGVSEETIRRDLEKLEKEGLCTKSYGGALLRENGSVDLPFAIRQKKNMEGKRVIAGHIAGLLEEGDHIFLDASTTALSILEQIRDKEITVITNSVEVLMAASEDNRWSVMSTGGTLMERYMALVGPMAMCGIQSVNADKVILSCKGIDMEKGITDANELFAQVKQTMLRHAGKAILAVDYTKFNRIGFSNICGTGDIDLVVTDRKPSQEWLACFKEKGVECIYGEQDA